MSTARGLESAFIKPFTWREVGFFNDIVQSNDRSPTRASGTLYVILGPLVLRS